MCFFDMDIIEYDLKMPPSKSAVNCQDGINSDGKSIIIIGANGSGKSRLGAWIERNNIDKVHRIGAQKSLTFNKNIQLRNYDESINLLCNGTSGKSSNHHVRWGHKDDLNTYVTVLLNDYEYVLSAFLAKYNNENKEIVKKLKECKMNNTIYSDKIELITDKLKKIWTEIFSNRNIDVDDSKVISSFKNGDSEKKYYANEMSDGERVALYLILQALVIPENKTIIIDEPEIHLHRSIMNRLWTSIEEERPDCLFVYITHDTEFAAQHKQSKKIWVKNYDGDNWEWEEIKESELPEDLLLTILGSRKPVLFVEGESDSYDAKLFSEIYNDYYVKPCGSCEKVIENTKAMNRTEQLHDLKCYGLIDRDYRTDEEIKNLANSNIFVLDVAEIENLFLVPELLEIVNKIEVLEGDKQIEKAISYIIEERFAKEINKQISCACIAEIKYKLSTYDLSSKNDAELKNKFEELKDYINYDKIQQTLGNKYQSALNNKNYKEILKLYNQKKLVNSVGYFFKHDNKDYCDFILRLLKTDKKKDIIKALLPYLPTNKQIPNLTKELIDKETVDN